MIFGSTVFLRVKVIKFHWNFIVSWDDENCVDDRLGEKIEKIKLYISEIWSCKLSATHKSAHIVDGWKLFCDFFIFHYKHNWKKKLPDKLQFGPIRRFFQAASRCKQYQLRLGLKITNTMLIMSSMDIPLIERIGLVTPPWSNLVEVPHCSIQSAN